MKTTTVVIEDTFKQGDAMFNQEDDMVVGGFDVAIRVVTDEVDMNMYGYNSDEDKVHVNDKVPVR